MLPHLIPHAGLPAAHTVPALCGQAAGGVEKHRGGRAPLYHARPRAAVCMPTCGCIFTVPRFLLSETRNTQVSRLFAAMRRGLPRSRRLCSRVPPRVLHVAAPRLRGPAGIAACSPGTRETLACNSGQQSAAHICLLAALPSECWAHSAPPSSQRADVLADTQLVRISPHVRTRESGRGGRRRPGQGAGVLSRWKRLHLPWKGRETFSRMRMRRVIYQVDFEVDCRINYS